VALRSLQIEDLRCISHAQLDFSAGITLIHGANGSGKSSILEAIYLLGRGRSFRTVRLGAAIRTGSAQLRVVGSVTSDAGRPFTIGLEATPRQTRARIAGEPAVSLAALSTAFPVQIIEPGVHKLVEEGSVRRRRYLDWGVFHVEHSFLEHWQRFHRVVKQRNAALRAHAADDELDAWDGEFAAAGEGLHLARQAYLEALKPYVARTTERLLLQPVALAYSAGWPGELSLAEALRTGRQQDRRRKTSLRGPQRADLVIRCGGQGLARETVSRGQQKLLAAALILGQLAFHADRSGMRATLLLDDPAAELDSTHLRRLVEEVHALKAQVVITALHPERSLLGPPEQVFHVEHGTVTRV
jgi:DNA replication and repair protein RecF